MAELTVDVSHDGYLINYRQRADYNYATVRSMAEAPVDQVYADEGSVACAQHKASTNWQITRGWLLFDTSSLPDNAVISAAKLRLYLHTDNSDQDFDVVIVSGRGVPPALDITDYGTLFGARTSLGVINTANVVAGWNEINLNATGIALISVSGNTSLGLRSSRDIAGNEPAYGVSEGIAFRGNTSASEPDLVITYTAASPSVQTDAASSITTTGATMNGTLTDDGGAAKDCNFEWGRTTAYGTTTAAQSKETAETFLQALTGLLPNTLYHFRALADGATGADKSFMTLAAVPGDGAAPGPSIVSGLVGTLRHYWEPGKYRLEIGLGGYGRAFVTTPWGYYGAADAETQPDLSPAPPPVVKGVNICYLADQAFLRYQQAYMSDFKNQERWLTLWNTYVALHAACSLLSPEERRYDRHTGISL